MDRVYSIQALRFAAALLVLIGHAFIYTNEKIGGLSTPAHFFGRFAGYSVVVFFVISGYVIALSCQRMTAKSFIVQRLLRIYLGFLLAVALVVIAKIAIWGGIPSVPLASLTLLPFGEIPYLLFIEWSLVFEVLFYVLFAIAWIPRSNAVIVASAFGWLLAILVGTYFGWDDGSGRFTSFPEIIFNWRNVAFILGVFVFYLHSYIRRGYWFPFLSSAVGLATVGWVFPVSARAEIVFDSFSATALLAFTIAVNSRGPLMKRAALLGDASYGIYLTHVPFITILLALSPASMGLLTGIEIAVVALVGSTIFGFIEVGAYRRLRSWQKSLPVLKIHSKA